MLQSGGREVSAGCSKLLGVLFSNSAANLFRVGSLSFGGFSRFYFIFHATLHQEMKVDL
jgi:hypothetical protein